MVHQVDYNGQMHEFPDEATPEMISNALGLKSSDSNKKEEKSIPKQENSKNISPMNLMAAIMSGEVFGKNNQRGIGQRLAKAPLILKEDLQNLFKKTPQLLSKGASEVASLPSAFGTILSEPKKSAEALGRGLYGAAQDIQPSSMGKYAEHLGILNPNESNIIPSIPDLKFENKGRTTGEQTIEDWARAIPQLLTGGSLLKKTADSAKLTAKGVAKGIVKSKKEMFDKFSGEKGLYTDLFDRSRKSGLGDTERIMWDLYVNPKKIDLEGLKPTPDIKLEAIENFIKEPTLENGQSAVSDLGKIIRQLEKKTSLWEHEKAQLKAAKDAKKYISKQMFTDNSGTFHPDLAKEHKVIQKKYAKEAAPYMDERDINAYEKGKMSAKNLVKALANKKYGEELRQKHPEIKRQRFISKIGNKFTRGAGSLGFSYMLLDKLMNKL